MRMDKQLKFSHNGDKCIFKTLTINDVTESYIQGLKHQKRYLVNNPEEINIKWQQDYIKKNINIRRRYYMWFICKQYISRNCRITKFK